MKFNVQKFYRGSTSPRFIEDRNGNPLFIFKQSGNEDFGIPFSETPQREVLAYILDQGFAKVPETFLITFPNVGIGSAQKFIPAKELDMVADQSQIDEISLRRVGIHHLHILQMDPDVKNILVNEEGIAFPIDHGYSLPQALNAQGPTDSAFLFNKRLRECALKPFLSDESAYIMGLDEIKEGRLLKEYGLSDEAVSIHNSTIKVLKKGLLKGLTLFDLSVIFYARHSIKQESGPREKKPPLRDYRTRFFSICDAKTEDAFEKRLDEVIDEVNRIKIGDRPAVISLSEDPTLANIIALYHLI